MNRFRRWYLENYVEITWLLIGILLTVGLISLAVGNYFNALINFGLAYLNFVLRDR